MFLRYVCSAIFCDFRFLDSLCFSSWHVSKVLSPEQMAMKLSSTFDGWVTWVFSMIAAFCTPHFDDFRCVSHICADFCPILFYPFFIFSCWKWLQTIENVCRCWRLFGIVCGKEALPNFWRIVFDLFVFFSTSHFPICDPAEEQLARLLFAPPFGQGCTHVQRSSMATSFFAETNSLQPVVSWFDRSFVFKGLDLGGGDWLWLMIDPLHDFKF